MSVNEQNRQHTLKQGKDSTTASLNKKKKRIKRASCDTTLTTLTMYKN